MAVGTPKRADVPVAHPELEEPFEHEDPQKRFPSVRVLVRSEDQAAGAPKVGLAVPVPVEFRAPNRVPGVPAQETSRPADR